MASEDVMHAEEPREPVPALTVRALLLELRQEVRVISDFIVVQKAANLPHRVDSLESTRDKEAGRNAIIAILAAMVVSLGIRMLN